MTATTRCDNCGDHTDKPFNASDSATLVHVTCAAKDWFNCRSCELETDTCAISQSYMEGSSWDATVVEDIVFLGGDSSFENEDARNRFGTHFKFGCQHKETGLFIEQVADGIMGLSNTDNHLVAKLHQENKIPSKLFALCFGEDGGSMTVGEPDTQRHRGEIQYAKVIGDRSSGYAMSACICFSWQVLIDWCVSTAISTMSTSWTFGSAASRSRLTRRHTIAGDSLWTAARPTRTCRALSRISS